MSHDVYIRYSKRLKQLQIRMHRMIEAGIDDGMEAQVPVECFVATLPSMMSTAGQYDIRWLCF
jgi:hypothetical protein